jgi:hypothetical protein
MNNLDKENMNNLDKQYASLLQDIIDNGITEEKLLDIKIYTEKRIQMIRQEEEDEIKRKNSVKNKTKLCQLTSDDRILGIRISWNDDSNGVTIDELGNSWSVDIIGYCEVRGYEDKKKSDYHRISIGHKKEAFGISTSLSDEESEKPYLLSIDTMNTGYDSFFTLSPETWESDLIEALNTQKEWRNRRHDKEILILEKKVEAFLKSGNKINKFIKNA